MPHSPERRKEYRREYYERNKERLKARSRKYHHENREKILPQLRARWLERNYGLTVEEYRAMVDAQDGRCAICGKKPKNRNGRPLHVDHCHSSGETRGLLCAPCNTTLGYLENAEWRAAADAYVATFKKEAVDAGV